MHRTATVALACAITALVAACGTPPPPRYFTLSASTAAPSPAVSTLVVAVGPVTVPAMVDRPEFVVRTSANEVRLEESSQWAAPLQENLARVIAEDLALMLGTPRVTGRPQPMTTEADYRVAVDVRTFDSVPGDSAIFQAVWTIRRAKDGSSQTGRTSVRELVADGSHEALAAAHSRAVARMSQEVADAILAVPRSAP